MRQLCICITIPASKYCAHKSATRNPHPHGLGGEREDGRMGYRHICRSTTGICWHVVGMLFRFFSQDGLVQCNVYLHVGCEPAAHRAVCRQSKTSWLRATSYDLLRKLRAAVRWWSATTASCQQILTASISLSMLMYLTFRVMMPFWRPAAPAQM